MPWDGRIFWGIVGVYVALGSAVTPSMPIRMPSQKRATRTIQGHEVTVYGGSFESGFTVRKDGKEIYRQTGQEGFVVQADPDASQSLPEDADLFGDGTPVLMMGSWSGGAHCCYAFYFFALEPSFHLVQKVNAGHSGNSSFFEHRGKSWLLRMRDWTFAYWDTGFASSPAPEIILRFDHGSFRPALDLMEKPLPNLAKVIRTVKDPAQWRGGEPRPVPPVILEATMLDLLYTGHAAEAWQFLNDAWPEEVPGKTEWLVSFKAQLAKSPWWSDLLKWNQY